MRIPILICLGFCMLATTGHSQNFSAQYKVTREVVTMDNGGGTTSVATLDLTGYLYQTGERYISFARPHYLDKYPDGYISVRKPNEQYPVSVSLYMDTLQTLRYLCFDSLLARYRNDRAGSIGDGSNFARNFPLGMREWEFTKEVKEINGLKCQQAILKTPARKIFEVWFCADIPIKAGPHLIFDLPGLVVEMESFGSHEKWLLESYNATATVPESVIWPAEFNQPFQQLQPFKKAPGKTTGSSIFTVKTGN